MTKKLRILLGAAVLMAGALTIAGESQAGPPIGGTPPAGVTIFVTSQGLYYDSIVLTGLPLKGPFQLLEGGSNGLQTEFGPGDRGYLGGRWWVDVNEDGEMNTGDLFFSCPLLAPGRDTP